jgi:hypothetical protein
MRTHAISSTRTLLVTTAGAALLCLCACGGTPSIDAAGGAGGQAGAGGGTAGSGGGTAGSSMTVGTGGAGIETDAGPMGDGSNKYDSPDSCGQSSIQATVKVVDILLVIDKSGSMTATPNGFTSDKWTAMKTALSGALGQVKGGISFGLELFPNNLMTPIPTSCTSQCWDMPPGDAAIEVPVGPGTTTVPVIISKFDAPPAGGTPTAAALKAAADYFTTGSGKNLTGDKYVLLATDGGPNGNGSLNCDKTTCTVNMDRNETGGAVNYCSASVVADGPSSCLDDQATVAQLSAMATAGIKTFVVGIPGTDPYVATLDAMAVAGGVAASMTSPKYFAVSAAGGVSGLQQVFESITQQLIKSCRLQLQSNPPDLGLLNVYVDKQVIPKPGADGWDIDMTTTPPTIVLKGATCAQVETMGATSIDVQYGCPTVIVR